MDNVKLLVPDTYGQYVPLRFINMCGDEWSGISSLDREILMRGPTCATYWETWDDVLDHATRTDKDGNVWRLWHDGDVFEYTGDGEMWT